MRRVRIELESRMLRLGGPQDRITDHRAGKSWHHIEEILNGHLDPIVSDLQKISQK